MKSTIAFILFLISIVLGIYFYYSFNKSYVISKEAKEYYKQGNFKEAYALAKKAYEEDFYNRQAFTLMVHSKESKKWIDFINESKRFLSYMQKIAKKDFIEDSELARIKMMSEITIEKFKKLNQKNRLIDDSLKRTATKIHQEIVEVYEKLFKNQE